MLGAATRANEEPERAEAPVQYLLLARNMYQATVADA